jgi:hypothetical protein
MPDDQPEDIIPHLLRDVCERMATKDDIVDLRLEHPAFKWSHLKADKMLDIQRFRASDNPKTAHTFGSDALDLNLLRADVASDLHGLDAKIDAKTDALRKDLSDQIVGLRRAVVEYHSAIICHGNLIADLDARIRRVEQRHGLESH